MSKVFVSIASYRDPELVSTLKDLVIQAASPENLHVAVCWQNNESAEMFQQAGMTLVKKSRLDDFEVLEYELNQARIDVIDVEHYRSQGACWARSKAEKCYSNEDYFLQIDSHCRFIKEWDHEMVALLTSLKKQSDKPVLSHYPAGYNPDNEDERFKHTHVSRIVFYKFNDDKIPITYPNIHSSEQPVRSIYIAGGFIFAEGSFIKEVPNDPEIFFSGEEIMMAARAFTHGYDIYTPHKILLWHYYKRTTVKVWDDHNKEAKETGKVDLAWWERNNLSNKRLWHFFGIKEDEHCQLGIYAPGNIRSLRDFEYASGISFKKRALQPEVISKKKVNWFSCPPTDHSVWEKNLIAPYNKKALINKKYFHFGPKQIERWHLTVLSNHNYLIDEIIFTAEEVKQKLESAVNDNLEFDIEFNIYPDTTPETIRIIPFFLDATWGEAVEIKW